MMMKSKGSLRKRCGCNVSTDCECEDLEAGVKSVAVLKLYKVVGPLNVDKGFHTAQEASDFASDCARAHPGQTFYTLHPSQVYTVEEMPVKVAAFVPTARFIMDAPK